MKHTIVAAAAVLSLMTIASTGAEAHRLSGTATYYGGEKKHNFCGRKTASGVRFNCGAMTAAHRTLPFGTVLNVTNPRTGRSVHVTINDRGPFTRAFLDLSPAAAGSIGGRSTHHGLVASVVSMGNGATTYNRRGRTVRASTVAIAAPVIENPFAALFGGFGQTRAEGPVQIAGRHRHVHHGKHHRRHR